MTRSLCALALAMAAFVGHELAGLVGQDFSPAVPRHALIRGRATDTAGRPLRLVHVDAVGASGSSAGAITGLDGRYELNVPAPDAYIVTAGKPGYVTVEFGQRRPGEAGTRVRAASSETVERTDFTLPRAGAISGRVVDENGDPIEGATVSLLESRLVDGRRWLTTSGMEGSRRQTDDRGRFRLFGVQAGRYVLAATVASAGPHRLTGYAITYYPGVANAAEAEPIAIGPGDDWPEVEFRMLPGRASKVSGMVFNSRGEPFRGRLFISRSQRSGAVAESPAAATVRPDGSFEFTSIASGDYVVQAIERGFPGGEFAFQYVTVADADVAGITLRTSSGSTMHGRVVLEGDTRSVTPQDFKFQFIQTDFDRSPSGTYRAKINDDWTVDMVGLTGPLRIQPVGPPGWLLKSVRAGGADITDDAVPFGRADDSLGDVEVVMTTRGASLTGTVVDVRKQTVNDYVVVVFAADPARWYPQSRFLKTARSAADGTFEVRGLPSGDFLVAALPRPPAAAPSGELQDPARLDALTASATRVTLTEGQPTTVSVHLTTR